MNRFFPYSTLGDPLTLVADTQTVDGVEPPVDLLAARRNINLSGLPEGWRRATFRMRLELPNSLLSESIGDPRVVLSINCPSTNLRFGVQMVPGARLGTYVADLEIESGALARRATLRAVVSSTIDGVKNRYYGESQPWNVWVTAPEIPMLTGDLDVQWADFTGDNCPSMIDQAFKTQAYYVDITSDPPVIWLNEGVPDLRRLFDDSPRRPRAEVALRSAHFHAIANVGWLAMFNASLGAIERDGDGSVGWPGVEWQRQVLLTILPKIYPDLSSDDSLKRAYEDDGDQGGARLLQSRAMAAVYGLLKGTQELRRSIKALEVS